MKIRAVLVDMDGTLLGRSRVAISRRNMRAIQKLLEMGVQIIPCTGRVYDMLPPQLFTQEGLRYFVTCHGAYVYDRLAGECIHKDLIPAEQAAELLRFLEGKGLYNEISSGGTIYYEKTIIDNIDISQVPEHHIWYVRDNRYKVIDKPSEYFLSNNIAVEKMNLYGIPEEMRQEIYDFLSNTGYIQYTRPRVGANLEFTHKGMKKLHAVDVVLNKLGISYEETLAIGDSNSDVPIIQACGIGVAMGNAPCDVQAIANVVTGQNVEDGFAQAIEKYVL